MLDVLDVLVVDVVELLVEDVDVLDVLVVELLVDDVLEVVVLDVLLDVEVVGGLQS